MQALTVSELTRAEDLERRQFAGLVLSPAEALELANLKAKAKLMQYQPESEVAAAYLKAMKQKCADEFAAWLENQALKYGKEIIPLLLSHLPDLIKSAK